MKKILLSTYFSMLLQTLSFTQENNFKILVELETPDNNTITDTIYFIDELAISMYGDEVDAIYNLRKCIGKITAQILM